MDRGRPTDYTPELAKEICDMVASCSTGIKKLCATQDNWPAHETIYRWLRQYKEFSDLYARAKKDQVRALVEEILEISDDSSQDDKENSNGTVVCNSEWVARSRLRVDTRKWIAAKLVPRLYGDNVLGLELAKEMEEFKKLLSNKKLKEGTHGEEMDSSDAHEKGRSA